MFLDHKNLILGRLDQIRLIGVNQPIDLKVAGYNGPVIIESEEFLLADVSNADWQWSSAIECDFDGSFNERPIVVQSGSKTTGYVKVRKLK